MTTLLIPILASAIIICIVFLADGNLQHEKFRKWLMRENSIVHEQNDKLKRENASLKEKQ